MEERPWTKSEFFAWSDGRRIVDLYELSKQLQCKQCSSLLDLRRTEREARYGLASVLYILCNCGVMNDVHTGRTQQDGGDGNSRSPMYEVNIKASINLLMYGAGANRILSFLALLDIPVPPPDDTSLIVPVTEDAEMQNVHPALSPPPTSTASAKSIPPQPRRPLPETSSSFQKAQPSSYIPDPGFSSVPQPLPLANDDDDDDDDDNEDALPLTINQKEPEKEEEPEPEPEEEEEEEEEEVSDIPNDDDDEEYVPPSKSKSRVQPKPAPPPKKKSLLRGPKSARAKQAAKLAAQKRALKIKVKVKKEKEPPPKKAPESDNDDSDKEVQGDATGEKEKEKEKEKEFVNPMEWSSTESETESAEAKDSDVSWHEEEEDQKEDDDVKPKRKRGRPKGSTDKAKRTRKSGLRTKKEKEPVVKKLRFQGEEKDLPRCTACAKDFNSIKGYNVHMKRVHNQEVKGRKVYLLLENQGYKLTPYPFFQLCHNKADT